MFVTYRCGVLVSRGKKIDALILAAIVAHHTLVLTSCAGTPRIDIWLSADQLPLQKEFVYPLSLNQASQSNRNYVASISPAYSAWSYWFTKSVVTSWTIEFVNNSWLTWMRVFFVFSYCLEWNLLFENFTYLLTVVPLYTAIPLSPVFSVCIMHNAHGDLQNTNTLSGRQGGRKPVGDICV